MLFNNMDAERRCWLNRSHMFPWKQVFLDNHGVWCRRCRDCDTPTGCMYGDYCVPSRCSQVQVLPPQTLVGKTNQSDLYTTVQWGKVGVSQDLKLPYKIWNLRFELTVLWSLPVNCVFCRIWCSEGLMLPNFKPLTALEFKTILNRFCCFLDSEPYLTNIYLCVCFCLCGTTGIGMFTGDKRSMQSTEDVGSVTSLL